MQFLSLQCHFKVLDMAAKKLLDSFGLEVVEALI
jgi:hypothetical protein